MNRSRCCHRPKQTSSRPESRTVLSSVTQWRDPYISPLPLLLSLPLLLPLLLLLLLPLPLLLFLLLLVLCRHSERSEESPHFRGERSDPSAFLFHHSNTVISTGAAYSLIVSRAAEKPASLPIPPLEPNPPSLPLPAIPHSLFFLDCITTSAPAVGCGVSSGVSVKASAPAWRKEPTYCSLWVAIFIPGLRRWR